MERVTVRTLDGEVLARETFENSDTAQAYWTSLLGDGSVLEALPYRCVTVVREELFKGEWVETCRKLADLGDDEAP